MRFSRASKPSWNHPRTLAGKSRRHLVLALSTRSLRCLAAVCKPGVTPTFPGGFKATSWELGSCALARKTCRPRGALFSISSCKFSPGGSLAGSRRTGATLEDAVCHAATWCLSPGWQDRAGKYLFDDKRYFIRFARRKRANSMRNHAEAREGFLSERAM